jgi:hypothetical protein
MFLRAGCTLPNGLDLKQVQFGNSWMSVENAANTALDAAVRKAGWHFMWIVNACSRFGFGRTGASAAKRAITRALEQTQARFNAAELGSIKMSQYPGFQIARATLLTRHIQERASLGLIDEMIFRQLAPQ